MKVQRWVFQNENKLTMISGILIVVAVAFRFGSEGELIRNIALVLATVTAVTPIMLKAWGALKYKAFSIELLVTIAVMGALFINEYVESAAVSFLFLFGAYLEARTLEQTRSSIRALTDMAPQEAMRILEDGSHETIAIEDVQVGDRLIVLSGGKVPVDGFLVKGNALVNESAITGESVPVTKTDGSELFSGTIVDTGHIEMIADKVGDDTTFAKIIEIVEEAQDSKSETERFLDRFAQWYTPLVIVLSVLVGIGSYFFSGMSENALHLAITFLVVACPGALVIGAPVSTVAGIGNGAKNGTLIKGGDVMERFSKVDTLVFDKTGTLTKGHPEVTEFNFYGDLSSEEVLGLVGKLETVSEHHLGKAIVKYIEQEGINLKDFSIQEAEVVKARGIVGIINGKKILAGNLALMKENQIEISVENATHAVTREKKGNTAVYLAIAGELAALISIADAIRDDAKKALLDMRQAGIKHIVMLTGDNHHTAEAVSNELGIDEFYAELLPEEKVQQVKRLKEEGRTIAMAGDGINDAPAIATADIGLAMGAGGTDVSIETADIVLMADKLSQYAHSYSLAKETTRNLRQNILIALLVVVFLLIGVLVGYVNMGIGMFVHEGSVLIVIMNGMRLLRFKPSSFAKECSKSVMVLAE